MERSIGLLIFGTARYWHETGQLIGTDCWHKTEDSGYSWLGIGGKQTTADSVGPQQ